MKTLITHNGSFHADDVFACATLKLALKDEETKIIRTRDLEEIKNGDIVFDVGRVYDPKTNRFDHHQGTAPKRENGIPYASFGLIWQTFSGQICTRDEADILDKGIISFIDAIDNGIDICENKTEVSNYSIASAIGAFNSTSLEEDKNDDTFLIVVDIAKRIILREIVVAKSFILEKEKIEKAYLESENKKIIVVDEYVSKSALNDVFKKYPEVLFSVSPYHGGVWALRCIRKDLQSFENRKSLPEKWAGLEGKELQEVTGVPDAIFCHKALFVANTKSKEGALALAKLALLRS